MKLAEIELAAYAKVYELFLSAPIRSAFREADDGPDGEPPPTDPEMLVAVQADRFDLMSRLRELRRKAQQELPLDLPGLSADDRADVVAVANYLEFDGSMDMKDLHRRVRVLRRIAGVGEVPRG